MAIDSKSFFSNERLAPFLYFLPFLFLYLALIGLTHRSELVGDELVYIEYAQEFIKGNWSYDLWMGPGYPLLLSVLLFLKVPILMIKCLNAFFLYLSIVLLFKILRRFSSIYIAVVVCVLWGCYYPMYDTLIKVYTEPFTLFLLTKSVWSCIRYIESSSWKRLVVASFCLAYLVLTKVIFGYVLSASLLVFLVCWLFNKEYSSLIKLKALAIAFTIPYLIFTYSITSKVFYWGASGGASLYSMTTTAPHEYGNWIPVNFKFEGSRSQPDYVQEYATEQFQKNHAIIINKLAKAENVFERDDIYKKSAIANLKKSPITFAKNWIANLSRMLFRFPFSYYQHDLVPLLYILPNAFVIVLGFISLAVFFFYRKKAPVWLRGTLTVLCIYLGFSSVLSAYPRQFYVVMPLVLIFIIYSMVTLLRDIRQGKFDAIF